MKVFGIRIARQATIDREVLAAVEDRKWKNLAEASDLFRKEGYQEWCNVPPPSERQFLLIRAGWYFPTLTTRAEIHPYMNTIGAFWKLDDSGPTVTSDAWMDKTTVH